MTLPPRPHHFDSHCCINSAQAKDNIMPKLPRALVQLTWYRQSLRWIWRCNPNNTMKAAVWVPYSTADCVVSLHSSTCWRSSFALFKHTVTITFSKLFRMKRRTMPWLLGDFNKLVRLVLTFHFRITSIKQLLCQFSD